MIYNARYILFALALFVCLCCLPFLWQWGKAYKAPVLSEPDSSTACIEARAYMAKNHMKLLIDWRKMATRDNLRTYTASNGKVWTISLQNTCLSCHKEKEKFCDSCHNSLAVSPACWNCHQTASNRITRG